MKSWGLFLIIATIASAVLPYLGIQLLVLMWVDQWGSTIGWVIRGSLVAVGIALVVLASRANRSPRPRDEPSFPAGPRHDAPPMFRAEDRNGPS